MDHQELVKEREEILKELPIPEGVMFIHYNNMLPPFHDDRDDVTVHGFCSLDDVTPEIKQAVRRWLEGRGLQYSRQLEKNPAWPDNPDRRIERIYIGKILPVPIEMGYHATRRASLPSILDVGLKPSTADRQTTERDDCDGNIYVCEKLGTPEDEGKDRTFSAHWWRDCLARENKFRDTDWVIMEVDLRNLDSVVLARDMWSKSGIVVSGIERIPAERLRLVYP